MNQVTRPILRWHGGKWRLAPWIISYFPPHRVYVEPFGGGASVLLRKKPIPAECYNDLDGSIVNVFRQLRDPLSAGEIRRRLELTPYARAEFNRTYEPPVDDIDAACLTIARSFMGFGSDSVSRSCRTGFRARLSDNKAFSAQAWARYPDLIPKFCDRLSGVLIESTPATDIMARLDSCDTLHYVDPPYLFSTRSSLSNGRGTTHGYRHEMSDEDHRNLLRFLQTLRGYVVVSGYPSEIYDTELAGWRRTSTQALADGARSRTEVLWLNPSCCKALDLASEQASLPFFAREATA